MADLFTPADEHGNHWHHRLPSIPGKENGREYTDQYPFMNEPAQWALLQAGTWIYR